MEKHAYFNLQGVGWPFSSKWNFLKAKDSQFLNLSLSTKASFDTQSGDLK